MNRFTVFLLCLFLVGFSLPCASDVLAGETREDCRVCGMWIDQYMNTRHVLTEADGSRVYFCSFTCAAKYMRKHDAEVRQLQAADYLSAKLVDAADAYYLVGSDVLPVMSYTSIIAFADITEVNNFQKAHGGRVMTVAEVLAQY